MSDDRSIPNDHGDAAAGDRQTERRRVEVADPGLSDGTNRALTEEVRAVVGSDTVEVPVDEPRPSLGERDRRSVPLATIMTSSKFLLKLIGAAFAVILGIFALLTDTWWLLAVAVVLLLVCTAWVSILIGRMVDIQERPDPTVVARMEEEGIRNPEQHFTRLVEEFSEDQAVRDPEGKPSRIPGHVREPKRPR